MIVYKPPRVPHFDERASLFLAGTIDNGNSADWQAEVESELKSFDILVLNPRRDDWDATWEQSIANPKFKEQVDWELDGLDQATHILMYFASGSKSPITLLELGLMANSGKLIVCCKKDFWRRGNVEVICERHDILLFDELVPALQVLQQRLETDAQDF